MTPQEIEKMYLEKAGYGLAKKRNVDASGKPYIQLMDYVPTFEKGSQSEAALTGFNDAVTLGAWPHISAFLSPGNYNENLKAIRGEQAQMAEQHPFATVGGEMAGSIVPYSAGVKSLSTLAKGMRGGEKAFITQTGMGAAQGATDSYNPDSQYQSEDVARGTATGAAVGMAVGGMQKLGNLAYRGAGKVLSHAAPTENSALAATGKAAKQIINDTRAQAIAEADKVFGTNYANNIIRDKEGKVITDMVEFEKSLSKMPAAQRQLVEKAQNAIISTTPGLEGAANANDVQRRLLQTMKVTGNATWESTTPGLLGDLTGSAVGGGIGYGVGSALGSAMDLDPATEKLLSLGGAGLGLTKGKGAKDKLMGAFGNELKAGMGRRAASKAYANRLDTKAPFGNMAGKPNMGVQQFNRLGTYSKYAASAANNQLTPQAVEQTKRDLTPQEIEAYYLNQIRSGE